MNDNAITNEAVWEKHWKAREKPLFITETYSFGDVIKQHTNRMLPKAKCIELGGFPGYFSIYLKKYCDLTPTLIDFVFNEDIFAELALFNGLKPSDVECLHFDIFEHEPLVKYDLVCSFGLVEHFNDLEEILKIHVKYMKKDATLLLSMPNFRGINGLVQRLFDPENLAIHNLQVMDLDVIRKAAINLGLTDVKAYYYPSTQVWLENLNKRGFILRGGMRILSRLMKVFGWLFGRKNKILSNNIVLSAKL